MGIGCLLDFRHPIGKPIVCLWIVDSNNLGDMAMSYIVPLDKRVVLCKYRFRSLIINDPRIPFGYAVGKPMVCLSSIRLCRERFETMSIQHSSNFQNSTMRTMISLLEISKERLMEAVPSDRKNHVDALFVSANIFAQEIEVLKKEVERLKTLNNNQAKMLWRNVDV